MPGFDKATPTDLGQLQAAAEQLTQLHATMDAAVREGRYAELVSQVKTLEANLRAIGSADLAEDIGWASQLRGGLTDANHARLLWLVESVQRLSRKLKYRVFTQHVAEVCCSLYPSYGKVKA